MKGDIQVEGLTVVETDTKIADLTVVIEAAVNEEVGEGPTAVVVDEDHIAGTDTEAELLIERRDDADDLCLLLPHRLPRHRRHRDHLHTRPTDLVIRNQT